MKTVTAQEVIMRRAGRLLVRLTTETDSGKSAQHYELIDVSTGLRERTSYQQGRASIEQVEQEKLPYT